jgi:hypothetical protein
MVAANTGAVKSSEYPACAAKTRQSLRAENSSNHEGTKNTKENKRRIRFFATCGLRTLRADGHEAF